MKSKIKYSHFLFLTVFLFIALFFANTSSAALVNCGGYNQAGVVTQCSIGDLIGTIKLIINYLLSFAWLVSVLFIVISGVRMILAQGNEEALTTAKASLTNAIVGFIIILTSFIVLNLVVGFLTGGGALDIDALTNAFDLVNEKP